MFKKTFKFCFFAGLALFVSSSIGYYAVRSISTHLASEKAQKIIKQAYNKYKPENEEEKVVAIAHEVHERFKHVNPSQVPLYRLRHIITNRRLPSFMSFPEGVLEIHLEKGFCDNASRMLDFILDQEDINSVQWNMVVDQGGHSARLVELSDGHKVLVDPFYGYIAKNKNKLLHPQEAQKLAMEGKNPEDIFVSFDNKKEAGFYKYINQMRMAAQGDVLIIQADIPSVKNGPVFLGEVDGNEADVKKAASEYKITPYWHYMGHKYNREWVRILKAHEPVKIIITLVHPAEKRILTASPAPSIDGKKLTWDLQAGQEIKFKDGLAKLSLKRLNSYINVDQIAIFPLGT